MLFIVEMVFQEIGMKFQLKSSKYILNVLVLFLYRIEGYKILNIQCQKVIRKFDKFV